MVNYNANGQSEPLSRYQLNENEKKMKKKHLGRWNLGGQAAVRVGKKTERELKYL